MLSCTATCARYPLLAAHPTLFPPPPLYTQVYTRGFGDGFIATKRKFIVGDGILSMTIARPWAAVKHTLRSATKKGDAAATQHYEFLSTSAVASSAFELWSSLASPGQVVKLVASAGNIGIAAKAAGTAKRLGIDIDTDSRSYRVGDVVAELRIPVGGICIRKTSSIHGKLARKLRRDLPFALGFELVKWYSPSEASSTVNRRVSYACSSFGVSIPKPEAYKPMH